MLEHVPLCCVVEVAVAAARVFGAEIVVRAEVGFANVEGRVRRVARCCLSRERVRFG